MNETGLLPREVKNNLDIVHSGVTHRSRCRYLMLHVCQSIKSTCREDKSKRLNILCRNLYNYVTLIHVGKQILDIISNADRDRVGSDEDATETFLNSNSHLGPLNNTVSQYAYMWQCFGMAFHFPVSDIKNIESANTDNSMRLYLVLDAWLSRKSSSATLPTLGNLRKALQSNLVSLGRLVKEVEEVLENISCQRKIEYQNVANQMAVESSRDPWCQVSSDVIIKEPSEVPSILLEVDALCCESFTPSCNWYKDEL